MTQIFFVANASAALFYKAFVEKFVVRSSLFVDSLIFLMRASTRKNQTSPRRLAGFRSLRDWMSNGNVVDLGLAVFMNDRKTKFILDAGVEKNVEILLVSVFFGNLAKNK